MRQKIIEPKIKMGQEILKTLILSMDGYWYPSDDNHTYPTGEIELGEGFCNVEFFPEENVISIHLSSDSNAEILSNQFIELYNKYESEQLSSTAA